MDDRWRQLGLCLSRLGRDLDLDGVARAGDAAIEVHLMRSGRPRRPRRLNHVDFVACTRQAVSPGVTSRFLVSHFHAPHPGYSKFLVQLVDPEWRMRVDVLPGDRGAIERAEWYDVCGTRVRVVGPDAILDHKLEILARATTKQPVDEKHLGDAVLLAHLCARQVGDWPPALFCKEEYLGDPAVGCARCDCSVDSAFPLAPKQRILDILGYC